MKIKNELPEKIGQGDLARLIPVGADTNKERKATSALLATLMVVPEYAKSMLAIAECNINSRSTISCYTEVVFLDTNGKPVNSKGSDRPDGVIIVKTGSKTWAALIEVKIANAELTTKQVESYLDLARMHNLDAVITISNQYANIPNHHPVKVNGKKTQTTKIFHWSWRSLLTEASLHTDDNRDEKDICDETQKYILSEFKRFLEHDSSGIKSEPRMSKSWSNICAESGLEKKTDDTELAVMSWHNLSRDLSLELSERVRVNVVQNTSRKILNNKYGYIELLRLDIEKLLDKGTLTTSLNVKDAAAPIEIEASIREKYLEISMLLKPAKDTKTAQGAVGWLTKQLKNVELPDIWVTACYAGKNTNQTIELKQLLEYGYKEINNDNKCVPHTFKVYLKRNLKLSELKGAVKFVAIARESLFSYYEHIGEKLKKPQIKAPKIVRKQDSEKDKIIQTVLPDCKSSM